MPARRRHHTLAVLLVALLVIAVAATGAWWYTHRAPPPTEDAGEGQPSEEANALVASEIVTAIEDRFPDGPTFEVDDWSAVQVSAVPIRPNAVYLRSSSALITVTTPIAATLQLKWWSINDCFGGPAVSFDWVLLDGTAVGFDVPASYWPTLRYPEPMEETVVVPAGATIIAADQVIISYRDSDGNRIDLFFGRSDSGGG
jgi:hypothetical protein